MVRKPQLNIAIICTVCLLCGMLCGFSVPKNDVGTSEATASGYENIDVYVDGILTASGYIVEDKVVYLPVSEFCGALKLDFAELEGNEKSSYLATVSGAELSVSNDSKFMTFNGRYFYLPDGAYIIGDEYCLPAAELAKLVCAQVQWDTATGSIDIDTTNMGVVESGDSYYNMEDLKWLSQIISAESGNQSLEGMMGVGNVVLNRVADPSCPDTVHDVIFDTRYGVQFSPVESGSIYNEPNEQAVIAAKLCLEGYNVAGSSLYFVNPVLGISSWFRETRTFVVSIGDHDFYA